MKRIYENVPLTTVLYTVSGWQKVMIWDYANPYGVGNNGQRTLIYDGLVKDWWGDFLNRSNKVERAKVHEIKAIDDMLCISICTAHDEY